jgi:hypothetical protein
VVDVNDYTFRQWARYCDDHPWLSQQERFVLLWLVNDHSASEGFTRPGLRRLELLTNAHRTAIRRALTSMTERGDIVLLRRRRARFADEYDLPWLHNPAKKPGVPAGGRVHAKRPAKRPPSSLSYRERKTQGRPEWPTDPVEIFTLASARIRELEEQERRNGDR